MAIVCSNASKTEFQKWAKELQSIAECDPNTKRNVKALARLLTKFSEMDIPFCELDNFCLKLLKEATEVEGIVAPAHLADDVQRTMLFQVKDCYHISGSLQRDLVMSHIIQHEKGLTFYEVLTNTEKLWYSNYNSALKKFQEEQDRVKDEVVSDESRKAD